MASAPSDAPGGSVYDLGYRRYEGVRLGRRHAVTALYVQGLRSAFGLGRRTAAKIAPGILIAIALFPAMIQLAIAALISDQIEIIRHDEYYTMVAFVIALYCAVVAPDILGRDQRDNVLPLYFSRPLSRSDYALGKFAALATAMLAITLLPQAVLFIGNGLAGNDLAGYARESWTDVGPIVASAILGSALIGAVGAVIAAQTPRRAYATVGIIVAFVLTIAVAAAITALDATGTRWVALLTPFTLIEGVTAWLFGVELHPNTIAAAAAFTGPEYAMAMLVAIALGLALLILRYRRIRA